MADFYLSLFVILRCTFFNQGNTLQFMFLGLVSRYPLNEHLFRTFICFLWGQVFGLHDCWCTTCMQCSWKPEEGSRFPSTGVKLVVSAYWVVGSEPEWSARAASAPICWTISPWPSSMLILKGYIHNTNGNAVWSVLSFIQSSRKDWVTLSSGSSYYLIKTLWWFCFDCSRGRHFNHNNCILGMISNLGSSRLLDHPVTSTCSCLGPTQHPNHMK